MKERIGPSTGFTNGGAEAKAKVRAKVARQTVKKIRKAIFSFLLSETAFGLSFKSAGRRD